MLSTNYGGLVPEDELLTHQIVDTFATVSQSDPSWTEKIWSMAHARDNSLQLVLGVGKYTNRGVIDAYAGAIVGWEASASKQTRFVESAIRQAAALRSRQGHPIDGAIHHSDAGSQAGFN